MNTDRRKPSLTQRLEKLSFFGALCFLFYLAFLEPPFLSYSNLPFPVLNDKPHEGALPRVHTGEAVRLEVQRCSRSRGQRLYPVSHALVLRETNEKTLLPATQTVVDEGCHSSVSAINVIPPGTASGVYYVSGTAEVNGTIATHTIKWESADFEVVP